MYPVGRQVCTLLNYTGKPLPSPVNWLNIENKAFNEPIFFIEKDTFFFIFPRFFQKILIFAIPKKASRFSGVFWKGGSSSFGRARPCQGRGGRFEPGLPLKRKVPLNGGIFFCMQELITLAALIE